MREIKQTIQTAGSLQILHAQGGHGKVDVGELHAVGEDPQVVAAIAQPVPIEGVAKAVVVVAADRCRVGPGSAVGHPLRRAAVDLHFHRAGLTDPTPDQANAAFEGTLLRTLQTCGRPGPRGDRRRSRGRFAGPGDHEILMRFGPAYDNVAAGLREVGQGVCAAGSFQVLHTQGGHGEIDVGELHVIGEGSQIVATAPQSVPVEGIPEAVVGIAAGCGRVFPGGAVGHLLPRTAIDLDFHLVGLTGPTPDQADAALERILLRAFQMGSASATGCIQPLAD